ncbi:transcriptional regulator [Kitasatospora sp. MMS16-BH015]|uniref:helix-turn-helix domain-containing protein n=1 Tax=Kitasatospora sp. MMS16-BH015 TaxID=2018025 RepID=UPI000CA0AC50|nr:hypothetical protein [Kitasatospora sp. MMS16-BH015]AUG80237.1 transcriptional regulator [Kitasatospora sp. MMS16-BH015]
MRELKVRSGEPSLRELARRTGLPRSTLADTFDPRRTRLPPLDRVLTIVSALGRPPEEADIWAAAWRTLRCRLANQALPALPESPSPASPADPTASTGPTAELPLPAPVMSSPPAIRPELPTPAGESIGQTVPAAAVGQRPRLLTLTVALPLTVLLAVTCALAFSIARAPRPPAATAAGAVAAGAAGPAAPPSVWRGRVAEEARIGDSTTDTVPVTRTVRPGDTLVLSLMLTSTTPGPITVTDSRGDRYRLLGDVTDDRRHRTVVAAGFAVPLLAAGDTLTVTHPAASKHHLAVDEFAGLITAGPSATGHGPAAGAVFKVGAVPPAGVGGGLLLAAVGTNSGSAPQFAPGWTELPVLALSSYRLSVAFRVTPDSAAYGVSGTTDAQWGAVLVPFG